MPWDIPCFQAFVPKPDGWKPGVKAFRALFPRTALLLSAGRENVRFSLKFLRFWSSLLPLALLAGLIITADRPAEAQVLRPTLSADAETGAPNQAGENALAEDGVITDGAPEPDPANPGVVSDGDWTVETEPDPSGDLSADGVLANSTDDPALAAKPQKAAADDPVDPFAPVGIKLGTFEFFPEVTTLGIGTDNALGNARNHKADAIIEVRPALGFRSDWASHSLSGGIGLVDDWHRSYSSEDTLELDASLAGRIDLTKRINLEAEAAYNQALEGRGDIEVPDAAISKPKVTTGRAALRYNQRFNRLAISLGATHVVTDHADTALADGTILSRADENTAEDGVTFRAGYEWLDGYEFFGEVGTSRLTYERAALSDGIKRDGDRRLVRAGVKVLTGKTIEGEAAIGWREFDPDDGRLVAIDGVVFEATLRFRPSELTTVSLSGQSDIGGTSIAGAAGVLNRSGRLEVQHNLTRSFIVIAGLGLAVKDFQGSGSKETTADANLDLEYLISRQWAILGGFDTTSTTTEASGAPDSAIAENRIRAGLRWRL